MSIRQGLKGLILAGALAGGLAMAAPAAQASTYILDAGSMDHARTVTIAGIGAVYAGPITFKATVDGGKANLVAWCVDVYHEITLGDYKPDLTYTDGKTLVNDFGTPAKALDAGDAEKVGLLVNYGTALYYDQPDAPSAFTETKPQRASYPKGSAGSTAYNNALSLYNQHLAAHNAAVSAYNAAVSLRYTRMAAVQSAIWQVMSNRDVTSTNHDTSFDTLVDNLSGNHLTDYFATGYSTHKDLITLIQPKQVYGGRNGTTPLPLTQSFALAQVPEPATWALMILGFGTVGAVLRRRRAATLA